MDDGANLTGHRASLWRFPKRTQPELVKTNGSLTWSMIAYNYIRGDKINAVHENESLLMSHVEHKEDAVVKSNDHAIVTLLHPESMMCSAAGHIKPAPRRR